MKQKSPTGQLVGGVKSNHQLTDICLQIVLLLNCFDSVPFEEIYFVLFFKKKGGGGIEKVTLIGK